MLVESLIKETVELQGFRVVTVQQTNDGLDRSSWLGNGENVVRMGN